MELHDVKILNGDLDTYRCRIDLNIEYAEKQGVKLHVHIIRPAVDNNEKFPLIVYSQGSSWLKQDIGKEMIQLGRFAKRGYVIALVEYRSVEVSGFPAQVLDTNQAIDYLLKKSSEYNIDKNNVLLWGSSSGAHTVLLCAMTKGLEMFSLKRDDNEDYKIRAVIDYYGPTDITKLVKEEDAYKYVELEPSPLSLLIDGANLWHSPEITDKMVPMNYIDKHRVKVPVFILHGTADQIVHYQQSLDLYECLLNNEVPTELYLLDGADHGGSCFWTEDIFDRIENFINEHIVVEK